MATSIQKPCKKSQNKTHFFVQNFRAKDGKTKCAPFFDKVNQQNCFWAGEVSAHVQQFWITKSVCSDTRYWGNPSHSVTFNLSSRSGLRLHKVFPHKSDREVENLMSGLVGTIRAGAFIFVCTVWLDNVSLKLDFPRHHTASAKTGIRGITAPSVYVKFRKTGKSYLLLGPHHHTSPQWQQHPPQHGNDYFHARHK